jgi:hypothetical protein
MYSFTTLEFAMSNHILYGEMHTRDDRDRIERLIRQAHREAPFKYLLTEEAGPYRYLSKLALQQAIKGQMYSISDRSFKLGIELGIPVIGIDNWDDKTYERDRKWPDGRYLDCRYSFNIREHQMVRTLNEYAPKGRVALIVGDSHLRSQRNLVMGTASPLYTQFVDKSGFEIIRAPKGEAR